MKGESNWIELHEKNITGTGLLDHELQVQGFCLLWSLLL